MSFSQLRPHALTGPYAIAATLPLNESGDAQVQAGDKVLISRDGNTAAYLVGLPYFRDSWLRADNLAKRWNEDQSRSLDLLDGAFLLLVQRGADFWLVNDKVSPLTWYWTQNQDRIFAASSLKHLMRLAQLPYRINYTAIRHYIFTRGTHFNHTPVQSVSKLLKGHLMSRSLQSQRYYDLPSRIRRGAVPAEYFDHLRSVMRQTLAGKKVAVLASNGFDSRLNCILLSECVDNFDIFTLRNDAYSEHQMAAAFLKHVPRQNFRIHTYGHSMYSGLPDYTPRRLYTHADIFLNCFDDLSMNKEHYLFSSVLRRLCQEGYDVLVNGCYGDSVRRVIPLAMYYPRPPGLDRIMDPQLLELIGVTEQALADQYPVHDEAAKDQLRERLSNGQINYSQALQQNMGLQSLVTPACTAQALEIYRGIDRTRLPGRGGINFFREFIAQQVPAAAPVPFDNAIAANNASERRFRLSQAIDFDYVRQGLVGAGYDSRFVHFLCDAATRVGSTGDGSILNIWAWHHAIAGSEEGYRAAFGPLLRHDPYLRPGSGPISRTVRRLQSRVQRAVLNASEVRDYRHPVQRTRQFVAQSMRRLKLALPKSK